MPRVSLCSIAVALASTLLPLPVHADSPPKAPPKRGNVAILVFQGVQIIDHTGPYEVFGQAGFEVYTVATSKAAITTSMDMGINPRYTFADCPKPDVLVLPGGNVEPSVDDPDVIRWIQRTSEQTQYTMSVCNGAFFLAKAGLLDGKEATTYYGLIDALREAAPKARVVSDKRFTDNGKILTTAGLSSGIDGSLHLVEKMLGHGTAQAVALNMEYRWDPTSTYARASFADKYMRFKYEGLDSESLYRDGDRDHWESAWTVKNATSAADLLQRVDAAIATQGKWTRVDSGTSGGAPQTRWHFKSEDGAAWSGESRVDPVAGAARQFKLTVRVARDRGTALGGATADLARAERRP